MVDIESFGMPSQQNFSNISDDLFCKDRQRYKSKVPKLTSPNLKFPDLSSSVDVVRNDQVGRHAVAARDIRAGELVAVEDPVFSSLSHFYKSGIFQFYKGKNMWN